MEARVWITDSEAATQALGRELAETLPCPATILLYGELGAGKTALTRGIAEGLGVEDPSEVHSPSFSLVNQYAGRSCPLYHIDLYRLDTIRDLYSIGIEEILADEAIVIIEWAEKLRLPVESPLAIRIRVVGEARREIEIAPPGTNQEGAS